MEQKYCVISHTHWDREWYQSFDLFRMRLVDLIDHLLDIVREDDQYIFHLDAQTIVLEDYLEIRPSRRNELEYYIRGGQIIVGPWFVQNDFYLSSGESTIRNLLIGTEIATAFGACDNVGYCPDQFGIIGQLPQILSQFGIRSFVFGRGLDLVDKDTKTLRKAPSELIWCGADGTKLLAVNMAFWYNNAQRFSADPVRAKKLVQMIQKNFEGIASTPYLLLMNGVDHMEAQEDLKPILQALNKQIAPDTIYQGRLSDYVEDVRQYVKTHEITLKEFQGELRQGGDGNILEGTLSSRIYLKQNNDLCEDILTGRLEPLYEMLDAAGIRAYPKDYLHYLWKQLVQNHAHDSICGCSRDAVHHQMEGRFARIQETAGQLLQRGMSLAATHAPGGADSGYRITLANTTQNVRNEIVEMEVYFPKKEAVKTFQILDADGNEVAYTLLDAYDKHLDSYMPINLPAVIDCDAYRIRFAVRNMAPYSFSFYDVRPGITEKCLKLQKQNVDTIENDHYRLAVKEDGNVVLYVKQLDMTIEDFLTIEDVADCGHSYIFSALPGDCAISSLGKLIGHSTQFDGQVQSLCLKYRMMLPARLDAGKRSAELIEHFFDVKLEINKMNDRIDISYRFQNLSDSHRVRFIIDTNIHSEITQALSAFELVKRRLKADSCEGLRGSDQPNAGVIFVEETGKNAVILNRGLHEYEHLTECGKIGLTVLRATGTIFGGGGDCMNGDDWNVPENQCHRELHGNFAVSFGSAEQDAVSCIKQLAAWRNPILSHFSSIDEKVFATGRAAVQDSEINEVFYRKKPFETVIIEEAAPFIEIVEGDHIVVTALKKAEKRESGILRFYHVGDHMAQATLRFSNHVKRVYRVSAAEDQPCPLELSDRMVHMSVAPNEIVTLLFEWE